MTEEMIKIFTENFSKESSYILGFVWADGYLNNKKKCNKILVENLREDLENLEHIFDKAGKWTKTYRKREGRRESARFEVSSKDILNFLLDCDYGIKSVGSADKIISIIPQDLQVYWWRGYFDGDGCFYYNQKNNSVFQVSFNGNYEQDWNFIEQKLNELNINFGIQRLIRKNGNKSSTIRITNKKGFNDFGDYLYQNDDDIFLTRKHDKFKKAVSVMIKEEERR